MPQRLCKGDCTHASATTPPPPGTHFNPASLAPITIQKKSPPKGRTPSESSTQPPFLSTMYRGDQEAVENHAVPALVPGIAVHLRVDCELIASSLVNSPGRY
jgi:hypothetical protein